MGKHRAFCLFITSRITLTHYDGTALVILRISHFSNDTVPDEGDIVLMEMIRVVNIDDDLLEKFVRIVPGVS